MTKNEKNYTPMLEGLPTFQKEADRLFKEGKCTEGYVHANEGEVWHFAKMFRYEHLPPHLQEISKHFHDLFVLLALTVPYGYEKSAMMRKLREAKDCAVTAFVK